MVEVSLHKSYLALRAQVGCAGILYGAEGSRPPRGTPAAWAPLPSHFHAVLSCPWPLLAVVSHFCFKEIN